MNKPLTRKIVNEYVKKGRAFSFEGFTSLEPNCFENYEKEYLDLSNNCLLEIDCKVFENLVNLKELEFDNQGWDVKTDDKITVGFSGGEEVRIDKVIVRIYQPKFKNIEVLIGLAKKGLKIRGTYIKPQYDKTPVNVNDSFHKDLNGRYHNREDEFPEPDKIYNICADTYAGACYAQPKINYNYQFMKNMCYLRDREPMKEEIEECKELSWSRYDRF